MAEEYTNGQKGEALIGLHDELSLTALTRGIKRLGYNVTPVTSVDDMLRRMGITSRSDPSSEYYCPYNLILMDANLGHGGSSGPIDTILRYVSHLATEGKLTVIGITGHHGFYDTLKNREPLAGVYYFEKPVDLEDLRSVL